MRVGASQTRFAELAGVSKRTLVNWEKGDGSPTALALEAFENEGADVLYIVSGRRAPERSEATVEQIRIQLYDMERDLLHPQPGRKAGEDPERMEAILLEGQAKALRVMLQADAHLLTPELADQAANLLEIVSDPHKLSLFRAADYIQQKKKRDQIKESFNSWIEPARYELTDAVKNCVANLALEYGVSIKALAELVELMHDDRAASEAKG